MRIEQLHRKRCWTQHLMTTKEGQRLECNTHPNVSDCTDLQKCSISKAARKLKIDCISSGVSPCEMSGCNLASTFWHGRKEWEQFYGWMSSLFWLRILFTSRDVVASTLFGGGPISGRTGEGKGTANSTIQLLQPVVWEKWSPNHSQLHLGKVIWASYNNKTIVIWQQFYVMIFT